MSKKPTRSSRRQNAPDAAFPTDAPLDLAELWLPFESQIQRFCVNDEATALMLSRQGNARRKMVQRLLESSEQGDPQACTAVTAFKNLLSQYVDEIRTSLESGGYSQREAETAALERLSQDPRFLQRFNVYSGAIQTWLLQIVDDGNRLGLPEPRNSSSPSPARSGGEYRQAEDYVIQTSQEAAIVLMALCDGKTGKDWKNDVQAGTRTYERRGLPHFVKLSLSDEERDGGLSHTALEEMTRELDADGTFAVLYVSRLLAPVTPLPRNALAYDWVSLDDVIKKIGWDPRSTAERLDMRRRVWNYLRFGARANIVGQRSTTYYDPDTREEIPTGIDGPIWRFMKEERPIQPSLFAEEEVPVRVQIAVSHEWTRLSTSPALAQFLPMGELLGSVPPDRPSGAWARALGLSLSGFWRRQPRAALDSTVRQTRRELLEAYTPKLAPPMEVLAGKNPRRALEYWYEALQILVDSGFLAKEGEAALTVEELNLPRKNWQALWLDSPVQLLPGPKMTAAVQRCAENLPPAKLKNLKTLPRKRGRPRKSDAM